MQKVLNALGHQELELVKQSFLVASGLWHDERLSRNMCVTAYIFRLINDCQTQSQMYVFPVRFLC